MGSFATIPTGTKRDDEPSEDEKLELGNLLSGRLADVDVDSVDVVRDVRERR
jgi:hypothetical protein